MTAESTNSKRLARVAIAAIWVAAAGIWYWSIHSRGTTVVESLQSVIDTARGNWWAIPAFIAAYAARPLLLFPASLLTIAGGILFGPVVGLLVVLAASNLSAMIAFFVGRGLTSDPDTGSGSSNLMGRWRGRMQQRTFATIMIMRLAMLPYDLVNYAAGYLRLDPLRFIAATAIGSLPGTVSYVLAGASIDRVDEGIGGFDGRVFAVSVLLFVVSLGIARIVQTPEPVSVSPTQGVAT